MAAIYLILVLFAFSGITKYYENIKGEFLPSVVALYSSSLLLISFVASLLIDWSVAAVFSGGIPEARTGPFVFIDFVRVATGQKVGTIQECLSIFEMLCSALFLMSLRKCSVSKFTQLFLYSIAGLFIFISLAIPYIGSSDVYAYIAQGLSSPSAYDPAVFAHPERYFPVFTVWGNPTSPSPYGPLFIIVVKMALSVGGGVVGVVTALRIFNVFALLLSSWSLKRLNIDNRVCFLFLIDPTLWHLYVVDVHNDILPAAFLIFGAAIVSRFRYVTVLLVACAGLIKLPFLLLGFSSFGSLTSKRARIVYPVLSVCIAIVVSLYIAGDAYPQAVLATDRMYVHPRDYTEIVLHVVLIVCAIYSVFVYVDRQKTGLSNSLSFVAISQFASEQYCIWGMPFLLVSSSALAEYLCVLPLASFLLSFTYSMTDFAFSVRLILICILAACCSVRLIRFLRSHIDFFVL